MAKKIAIGIDSSLNHTGLVAIDVDKPKSIVLQMVIVIKKARGAERLIEQQKRITDFFSKVREDDSDIVKVALENYAFGLKAGSGQSFSIGELGGVIKVFLHGQILDPILISPKGLKLFVAGNGNTPKDLMLQMTYKKYKIDFSSWGANASDAADAYGLARMAAAIYQVGQDPNYLKKLTKTEQRALEKALEKEKDAN